MKVIKLATADKDRIWNIVSPFNGDFISFHAKEYAKRLCFKDHDTDILKIAKDNDDCDDGLETVGGMINAECKNVKINTENYDTHIDLQVAMESVADTLH